MMKLERFAWITALAAVAAWGTMRTPASHEQNDDSSNPLPLQQRTASPRTAGEKDNRDYSQVHRSSAAQRSSQALENPDPLARMTDFLAVLSSCDAAGLDRIAAEMEEMQARGISLGPEADLVNYRAGQLKGADLLSSRTGTAADLSVMGSLRKQFEGWLQTSPMEARQWLDRLPPGKFRDEMSVASIANTAKSDPAAAIQRASILPASQQTAAGRAAAEELARSTSAGEISSLLQGIPPGTGTGYLTSLVDTLINAPEGDVLADSLSGDLLASPAVTSATLLRASTARAKLDPMNALDWAASVEGRKTDLPPGAVLSAAVRGMSLADLSRAEQWAAAHPAASGLPAAIAEHRSLLENRGNDENEYNRDD
ncbi:hypothetical protein KBB96_11130 [Luteolibacter ambystomatis]|uniref:Uncharacterized protein n=1 Tax=Luteolibacter ambystomatis TaxID=2824561 RepID=A0A975IZ83_9BACT|nr:hypothetical protein [Luteolibacter ambystomatis]QUE49425.1 hypothetical protein KBB96_11130 [Luteolibacter ambystomatis]